MSSRADHLLAVQNLRTRIRAMAIAVQFARSEKQRDVAACLPEAIGVQPDPGAPGGDVRAALYEADRKLADALGCLQQAVEALDGYRDRI